MTIEERARWKALLEGIDRLEGDDNTGLSVGRQDVIDLVCDVLGVDRFGPGYPAPNRTIGELLEILDQQ